MGDDGVKVAYWDTAQGPTPRMVGQIQGTPTIKFIKPKKKNKKTSNAKKTIADYNGAREFKALAEYADYMLPSFVTRINGEKDFANFVAKADKYALPKVLIFSKSGSTAPLTKTLSTEFRRRVLVGEVRLSKPNQAIVKKFKDVASRVGGKEKHIMLALSGDGDDGPAAILGKKFSWRHAVKFLKKHALKKPYFEDEVAQAKIKSREQGSVGEAAPGEAAPAATNDAGDAAGSKAKEEL